jgi:hypothetical protein
MNGARQGTVALGVAWRAAPLVAQKPVDGKYRNIEIEVKKSRIWPPVLSAWPLLSTSRGRLSTSGNPES